MSKLFKYSLSGLLTTIIVRHITPPRMVTYSDYEMNGLTREFKNIDNYNCILFSRIGYIDDDQTSLSFHLTGDYYLRRVDLIHKDLEGTPRHVKEEIIGHDIFSQKS